MGDKEISQADTLKLAPMPAGKYVSLITIKDTKNSQLYSSDYSFEVEPAYVDGWVVATEDQTNSSLAYVNLEDGKYKIVNDIYKNANPGKVLDKGIIEIANHTYKFQYKFALSIVPSGSTGPIDLNPQDMSTYGTLKDNFVGTAPSKNFTSVIYHPLHVYALDEDGNVYIRNEATYNGEIVPQTGKFAPSPVVITGGLKVKYWTNTSQFDGMMTNFSRIIAYNESTESFVVMSDGKVKMMGDEYFTNGSNEPHMPGDDVDGVAGLKYPDPKDLSEYEVVKMEAAGLNTDLMSTMFGAPQYLNVATILKAKADGKYYLFTFHFYVGSWGTSDDVDIDKMLPLDGVINFDTKSIFTGNLGGGSKGDYMMFTANNNTELHYLNLLTGTTKKLYAASSEITAMNYGALQNGAALGGPVPALEDMFMLGFADGSVTILNINSNALATGNAEVLYQTSIANGKVTAIKFMPNNNLIF